MTAIGRLRLPRFSFAVVAWIGLAAVLPSAAGAQSYGGNDQVLTIGAAGFRGVQGATRTISDDGYFYNATPGSFSYYDAPLPLPEGALIKQICEFVNDSDTGSFEYVQTYIVAVKLVPGGESPFKVMIPVTSIISTSDIGYGYYCTDPFTFTLQSKTDIDNDGTIDNVVYYLEAYVPYPSQNAVGFGGARITWARQVSLPPATPTFSDVPATDIAWPFVEALAASGITAGCGPGIYCPDAPLTRRQMAVFLAKALGLHWVD
jgi:hypothetical protein